MKNNFFYLLTGFVFALGLSLGGMLDPQKIQSFLLIFYPTEWGAALLFVLGSAVITYSVIYWRQVKCGRSRCGIFSKIPQGKIDSRLIVGALLFGVGWGLTGLCPAPAIARIALEATQLSTWVFVFFMFLGFKIETLAKKV